METQMIENILEREGCPLHYWLGGPQERPLVIFTHGLGADHRSFDRQIPEVIQHYRVLNWDVRGHGVSQPCGKPFTVPRAVDDLLALMDQVGAQQAVFVGHSNGTYIMQELVFRHPERVKALVMADGTCITWKMSALEVWLTHISPSLMNLFPYETLKRSSLPPLSVHPEVQNYAYEAFSMLTKEDYINLWKGTVTCLHAEPGYQIQQPLLLTHGDEDKSGNIAKICPQWAKREANCQYVVIPHARHFAIMDNPVFFNQLMMGFLAKWAPVEPLFSERIP